MRRKQIFLLATRVSSFLFLMFLSARVSSQSFLDISQCFNSLLQQQIDYTSTEELRLSTLAQVSESTYETFKRDGKLSAFFDFLTASANYSEFDAKRRNYFAIRKLDLDYYRAISTSSRVLGSQAYALISNCISQVARNADGFHYLYTIDDAHDAAIQFFWRSQVDGVVLKVEDSILDNATVVNGEEYRGHLYDPNARRQPTIGVASAVFLLKRVDTDRAIRISLTTNPAVNTGFISIPPVPRPAPAPKFAETEEDVPFVTTFNKKDGQHIGRGTPDCGDCEVFQKIVDLPGEVVSVGCAFGPGTHNNTAYCGKEGSAQAKWVYYTNDGNNQTMTMTIVYKKIKRTCVENCV